MDKTKFVANPHLDSEGFTELQLANLPNPKGWQEVDGVKLPAINWAERSDEEIEAAFQEWLQR
jgi:hypothetical protein